MWRVVIRREGEEKGCVSVEMLDSQRHDENWMIGKRAGRRIFCKLISHEKFERKMGRIGI